jgi:hypothetical protein
MLAFIVAVDTTIYLRSVYLCIEIIQKCPGAYIFLIEHSPCANNHFSNGALLNVGLRLSGLTPLFKICFCSFEANTWVTSPFVTVNQFITSNGYDNYEEKTNFIQQRTLTGYQEIFALTVVDREYSKRFYHYIVEIHQDNFLNLNTIPNTILIPCQDPKHLLSPQISESYNLEVTNDSDIIKISQRS